MFHFTLLTVMLLPFFGSIQGQSDSPAAAEITFHVYSWTSDGPMKDESGIQVFHIHDGKIDHVGVTDTDGMLTLNSRSLLTLRADSRGFCGEARPCNSRTRRVPVVKRRLGDGLLYRFDAGSRTRFGDGHRCWGGVDPDSYDSGAPGCDPIPCPECAEF